MRATSTPATSTQKRSSPPPMLQRSAPWGQRRTVPLQSVRLRRLKSERGRCPPSPECASEACHLCLLSWSKLCGLCLWRKHQPQHWLTAAHFPPPQVGSQRQLHGKMTLCEQAEGVRGYPFQQLTPLTLNDSLAEDPGASPSRGSPRSQLALAWEQAMPC